MTSEEDSADARRQNEAEPSRPTQLRRETWRYILVRTTREFGFDDLPDAAASLTYYGVLSIFPALIAVVAGVVVFGDGRAAIDSILNGFEQAIPGASTEGIRSALEELASGSGWFALLFGVVLTLWTVSRYVGAFARAMNRVYEVDEGRPFRVIKPQQLAIAVAFIVIVAIMAVLIVVSGAVAEQFAETLGIGEPWLGVWAVAKLPVLVLLAVLLIGMLYYATPNVHQRRFRWLSMGALIALTTLVVSSALFFVYVANFSNYDRIYRSLAGALIFLIWLWIANLAMLFGAEFDSEVERGRQLQAGIAAEEVLRMPTRDDQLAETRAERQRRQVEEGRRIRYDSAPRSPVSDTESR